MGMDTWDVWEQNLVVVINNYIDNYNGWTGKPGFIGKLKPTVGEFMVEQARRVAIVDPALVLGICRSESSMATAPTSNGGKFNIYGDSAHFNNNKNKNPLYMDYEAPTKDVFDNLSINYISQGLTTTDAIYKKYEGEAIWKQNVPGIKETQKALTGDPDNCRYLFTDQRKKALADLVAEIQKKAAAKK